MKNIMNELKSEINFKEGYETWKESIEFGIIPDTTKGFNKIDSSLSIEDQLFEMGATLAVYELI